MKVKLLHSTPLWVAAKSIRKCWASEGKSDTRLVQDVPGEGMHLECGEADKDLISRIGNKMKHKSVLEHLQIVGSIQLDVLEAYVEQSFVADPFSTVTYTDTSFVFSTNVRALQNIGFSEDCIVKFIPDTYKYLFLSEH